MPRDATSSEKFPPAGRPTAAVLAGGSLISDCCAFQRERAGDPNRSSAGPSPARLRPRSAHSPPAPRPRAPRADPGSSRPGSSPRRRPARLPRTAAGSFARRARPSPRRVSPSVGAAPPATMFCAISGVTPTDPVISARTGHVFERSLITKAIQVRPPPASDARRPRGARARARAPAREGFRSFSRLPRSPFPAIAPRSPPRPLSDRPSTPHHPLNPSRASSIVVLRRARNERTGDGRVPRDEAAPGAG